MYRAVSVEFQVDWIRLHVSPKSEKANDQAFVIQRGTRLREEKNDYPEPYRGVSKGSSTYEHRPSRHLDGMFWFSIEHQHQLVGDFASLDISLRFFFEMVFVV